MKLLLRLGCRSWTLGLGALIAGTAGGLCAAALIALINTALNRPEAWGTLLIWAFGGLVLLRVGAGAAAQILGNHFAQRLHADLCQDLGRRLLAVPLPRLEAIGMPRLLVTLTEDVAVIAWAIQCWPSLAINLAILMGCAAYLAWLSWPILVGVSIFAVVGIGGFVLLLEPARRQWREVWRHRERLVGHLRALTDGTKELKLHAARREAFLSGALAEVLRALRRAMLQGAIRQAIASGFGQTLFFVLVGILLFGMPGLREGGNEALTGYLLVAVYMMNPLWSAIETWPAIARGRLAVERVRELTTSLGEEPVEQPGNTGARDGRADPAVSPVPPERWRQLGGSDASWERLELKGVTFTYPADDGARPFRLGPLDFTLQPGEIVFLAGGNGSGKSIFAKVLTGLYPVEAGEIRLDGEVVTEARRDWYHGHFSAVFSDFYLFDRLLGLGGPDLDARAREELVRLELDGKVEVENGVFSSIALSSGQRKRLALLTTLLEDRPIYVLDEWAADQDPHYRDIFYMGLLPELRRRGKAIVVISHDDRYYTLGDRTVRLAYGQVAP